MTRARYFLVMLWLCSVSATAVDITVSGAWSQTVSSSDLASGVGSDLRTIESSGAQVTVDISNSAGSNWSVKVQRSDIAWPSGAGLSVRRTSDGTGSGTISGGAGYLSVTGADQTLFTGTGDRSGIRLQLRLDAVSVHNAFGNYGASVTYTVQ